MVLASKDQTAESGILDCADNLVGVEVRGVEKLLRFVAVAPFAISESIDAEMDEGILLDPCQAICRGLGTGP